VTSNSEAAVSTASSEAVSMHRGPDEAWESLMGDVVNLNKYRKTKQRASETREAEINREKFGRNKAQTAQDRLQRRQDDKSLDGKKLEDSTDKT
jgi:hypothetical protein